MIKINDFLHQKDILKQLRQTIASGKTSFAVEFDELLKFDLALARDLLDRPTEFFQDANRELVEITRIPGVRLAVRALDKTLTTENLRAEHLDKFVQVRGTVTFVHFNKLITLEGYGGSKEFQDFQRLLVDDCLTVVLKGDLVGSVKEGDRVTITGTLGAIREGDVYGYGLVANHIEVEK